MCDYGFFPDFLFQKANIEGKYSNDRNNTSDFHHTELTLHGKVWQKKPLGLISYSTVCTPYVIDLISAFWQVGEMNAHFEEERKQHMGLTQKQGGGKDKGGGGGGGGKSWGEEETQLLIKGVNLFPAGTVQR